MAFVTSAPSIDDSARRRWKMLLLAHFTIKPNAFGLSMIRWLSIYHPMHGVLNF